MADIENILDQGIQIPSNNSSRWNEVMNRNLELINNKFSDCLVDEDQVLESEFIFNKTIKGNIENSNTTDKLKNDLIVNGEVFNGSETKSFNLVQESDIGNKIPKINEEGHLVLPSGLEIW